MEETIDEGRVAYAKARCWARVGAVGGAMVDLSALCLVSECLRALPTSKILALRGWWLGGEQEVCNLPVVSRYPCRYLTVL
jgi:hypothetical protein